MKVASRAVVVLRCAFCRGALDDGDGEETLTCPDCATLVHDACQLELPACPTLGCGSLAPWEVAARRPVAAVRSARWGRGVRAAVVVAGLACALVAGPSPSRSAAAPAPERELSAWARLGANSVLVTRTERSGPQRWRMFGCTMTGPCEYREGWSVSAYDDASETHRRVRWVLDDGVSVEQYEVSLDPVVVRSPAPRRSYFTAPTFEGNPSRTPEDAFELVTVPAGTFPAAYERAGELGTDRETALVETWTASWCPVPLKIVRSWVAPGEPAELPTSETTVLVRFEPGAAR